MQKFVGLSRPAGAKLIASEIASDEEKVRLYVNQSILDQHMWS